MLTNGPVRVQCARNIIYYDCVEYKYVFSGVRRIDLLYYNYYYYLNKEARVRVNHQSKRILLGF